MIYCIYGNKRLQSFLMVLMALLVCLPCLAVSATGEDTASAKTTDQPDRKTNYEAEYTAVLYDKTSGLPTSEANAIAQSDNGFIWIGGYSGLIRYDGNSFHRYDSSVGITSVVSLFYDSKKRLWIGTNDNGIAVMENDEFKFYNRESGLNSSSIRRIAEDVNGDIMIATTMGMAYVDQSEQLYLIDDPQINKEYVCNLFLGEDNVLYGLSLSGMFFTVENKKVTGCYHYENEDTGVVTAIYPDPDHAGNVYLGTQKSCILYGDIKDNVSSYKKFDAAPLGEINYIKKYDDNLWICGDKGIGYFDKDSQFHQLQNIPLNNSIDCMMMDYEENMWFCSSRQGVMKYVPNRFVDLFHIAGLDSRVVNATCKFGDDLYAATDNGLLVLDKNYQMKKNKATELLDGIRIRCILGDGTGKLWMCTYSNNGLVCYDPVKDSYVCYNEDVGLLSNRVRMIKVLSNGNIAVAASGGMNIISNGRVIAGYSTEQGINNPEILSIEEAPDGRLYLGSDGDGIYVVNGTKVTRMGLEQGLKSEVILRLKKDPSEDLYWIITSNSISYMRDDKITTISHFPYSNNFDIHFDSNDRLWVLSSNGIYVVKKSDMLKDETIDYMLYDMNCGLPSAATVNSYSHFDTNGDLYIASSSGISRVNINEESNNNNNIRLGVPYITIDDETITVPESNEINIPSNCKRITIYANAFTYSLNNPHLQYYLEGFEDEPIDVTKQDMDYITYTNLVGGSYIFHLSIIDTMTGEVDKTITVRINKEKAFYELIWFRVVSVLVLILAALTVVMLYFRRKTKILIKEHEANKKLVNEMTNVFAKCVDMKDAYTNGHSFRVAQYTSRLARQMGKTEEEVERIYNIALLHDIGKISIPDHILNKPGRLNDEEYAVMKSHSQQGYEILKDITIAPELALGAGCHHERVDGKGYPRGLKGDEIPEVARMIAVADTFDAMYSTRPYRKKMKLEDVVAEIKRCSGTQLSPEVVEAFLTLIKEGKFVDENDDNSSNSNQAGDSDKKA